MQFHLKILEKLLIYPHDYPKISNTILNYFKYAMHIFFDLNIVMYF